MHALQNIFPRSLALLLLVALVAATGCETIRENPKTSIGAGAGAAAGGLAGGMIGRNTTGVVVGGLIGSLAGGGGGDYLRRAGLPKDIMIDTLTWLMQVEGPGRGGFFAPHPATGGRVRTLRALR